MKVAIFPPFTQAGGGFQDSKPPGILHPLHYPLLCVLFHRVESMQLQWEQRCVAQWWWWWG